MAHDIRCPHADAEAPPASIHWPCTCAQIAADDAEHAAELEFASLHEEGLA
jgi:hypothetical protein